MRYFIFLITPLLLAPLLPAQLILRERPPLTMEDQRLMPKNLARWHFGSTLILTDSNARNLREELVMPAGPKRAEGILLGDDETESFTVPPGTYSYVINLQQLEIIDRFFAKTFSGRGVLTVKAADVRAPLDSDAWLAISRPIGFENSAYVERDFAPIEAQYVAFIYEIEAETEIGSVGIMGDLSLAETLLPSRMDNQAFAQANRDPEDFYNFDFASIYSGSQIRFLSEGADPTRAEQMIDDDFKTYYDFPAHKGNKALVIDLDDSTYINKVSVLVSANSGTMRFYFKDSLDTVDSAAADAGADAPTPTEVGHLDRPSGIFPYRTWTTVDGQPLLLAQAEPPTTDSPALPVAPPTAPPLTLSIDPESLDDAETSHTVEVASGTERISIPVNNIVTRYVILTWEPDDPEADDSLRIFEISVFGPMPAAERLIARALPDDLDDVAPSTAAAPDAPEAPTGGGDVTTADNTTPVVPPVTDISEL